MWCLLCIGSLIAISAITLLSGIGLRQAWSLAAATRQPQEIRSELPNRVGTQEYF
jgi:hypothetical protein